MKPILSWVFVGLALQSAIGSQLFAENPTIQSLVGNLPVLSPENENLHRFQFTFDSKVMYGVRTTFVVSWSRQDQLALLGTAGEDAIPFWFLSQKQVLMFDTTDGTALVGKAGANFIVRADGAKLKFSFAITEDMRPDFALDLPSLLDQAINNGELKQTATGEWSLASVSKSGKSKFVAIFENSPPFQIRTLDLRDPADDLGKSPIFVVRDITINTEPTKSLPRFPAIDALPRSIKVNSTEELDSNLFGRLTAFGIGARSFLAQLGLRETKLRDNPALAHVDWNNAQRINDEIGPQLRSLLELRPQEP